MANRPFRLRVLDGITTCLQQITPANGYHFDLSSAVFRGRAIFGDNDPLPMLSILEPPLPIDPMRQQPDNPKSAGEWDLLIQGFVEDDPLNPTDPAHFLMADVKKCLAIEKRDKGGRKPNIFGMGGDVYELGIGPGVVRPPDGVSDKAYFWLTVTFKIAEKMDNPYE